jgi:hypothetical protein
MHAHKTNAILRAIGALVRLCAHRLGLRQSVVVRMKLSCRVIIVITTDSVLVRVRILQYPHAGLRTLLSCLALVNAVSSAKNAAT